MSRRTAPPLALVPFQQEAVDALAEIGLAALEKEARAPRDRHRIARHVGAAVLSAPTGAGKTAMLAAACARISAGAPIVWFWFAPFAGVIAQTRAAIQRAAPGLRPRDPATDRAPANTQAGDVLITTWQGVAARNAESRKMRTDAEGMASLDTLARTLREARFAIGAVVDEAHHGFRETSQSFVFLNQILDPDLLFLATATPDDADLERLRRALDIPRFSRVSASRASAVAARLNKQTVKAVTFAPADPAAAQLLDMHEVALRKAVDHHRWLKNALRGIGVPLTPLLLVQAQSEGWTPERVRDFLTQQLRLSARAVGIHTADQPDPDIHALAGDSQTEVLVFKMAVATGFDAPRAFCLCGLRPVRDANFGLQVVGRIMRVHPSLRSQETIDARLNTGYVFLADRTSQGGLVEAAERIKALADSISTVTDSLEVVAVAIGQDGALAVRDADGQLGFVLEPPPVSDNATTVHAADPAGAGMPEEQGSFFSGFVEPPATPEAAGSAQPAAVASAAAIRRAPAPEPRFRYQRRDVPDLPERLVTEAMPEDLDDLLAAVIGQVRFTPEHLLAAGQVTGQVQRTDTDIFDIATAGRKIETAQISFDLARRNAWDLRRISQHLDPKAVDAALCDTLGKALEQAGQDVPDMRALRRALDVILVRDDRLLSDALRRAMATRAALRDAAMLPETWDSDGPLDPSPLNLYGVMPDGLNSWEKAFADWLDLRPHIVAWWTRNVQRGGAPNRWGVGIVLPETGRMFYPDFIVGVAGRRTRHGVLLAETKERTETEDSARKSRTEHRAYGRALMIRYQPQTARFIRVEYDVSRGGNRDAGPLIENDLSA